jgi:hypothetical protein
MSRHSKIAAAVLAALLAAGCGVEPAAPPHEPLPVPFAVSDYYSPDGFFGDGELRGRLELEKSCPQRAPGAQGDCYTLTYRPGVKRFAGIFWQYPHNNWGFWPGHTVAPGASRITFQARGLRGGEALKVNAGQKDSPNAHKDSFQLEEMTVALTDRWAAHELPFSGADYQGPSGVLGAFMIALAAGDSDDAIVVYLDDVRWQR